MYGLAKLANEFEVQKPKPLKPAGRTPDADPTVQEPPFQVTTAHLQALDMVDDGYRLFRLMNR